MEIKHIIGLVLVFANLLSNAQDGRLISGTTTVVSPKDIQLDTAARVYGPASDYQGNISTETQSITYDFGYKPYAPTRNLPTKVAIYRLKIDNVDESKSGFIRGGMGNYFNTLLDVYYGSRANKNLSWALSANHIGGLNGPVEKKLSGYSDNNLGIHSKYFFKNYLLSSSLNYQRTVSRNYGVLSRTENLSIDPKTLVSKNPANDLFLDLGFKSVNQEKSFQFDISTSPYYFTLNDSTSEFSINNRFLPKYKLKSGTAFLLFGLDYSNVAINEPLDRNVLTVRPSFEHMSEDKRFIGEVGFTLNTSNDSTLEKKGSIYPYIKGSYLLSKELDLMVRGELTGGLKQQNLKSSYRNNLWLFHFNPNTINEKIAISTSIEISPIAKFKAKVGLKYKSIENFNYFSMKQDSLSMFENKYSKEATTMLNPSFEVSYTTNAGLGAELQFNYFNYTSEDTLFYTPNLITSLEIFYKVNKNLKLSTDISYISGLIGESQYKMNDIIDLNLKANYDFNEKLGAFINVNNLIGKKYVYFEPYASQGINIMGGLTYSF